MDISQQSSVTHNHVAASKSSKPQVNSAASVKTVAAVSANVGSSNVSTSSVSPVGTSASRSPSITSSVNVINTPVSISSPNNTSQSNSSSVEALATPIVANVPLSGGANNGLSLVAQHTQSSANDFTFTSSSIGQFNLKTGPQSVAAINPNQISPAAESTQDSAEPVVENIFAKKETVVVNPFADTQVDPKNVDTSKQKQPEVEVKQDVKQTAENESTTDPQADQPLVDENKKQQAAQEQVEQAVEQQQKKVELAEQRVISDLAKRDIEVKTHEQAHKAVGGMFAQSPSFSYEKGPDGKRYAVDGEVQIDVSTVDGDPQATFNKMQKVYAAAMAPVQPSSADIRVAAEAVQKMNQAKAEMAEHRQAQITPAEDIHQINELANTYKQVNDKAQGFEESKLKPFTKSNESDASKAQFELSINGNSVDENVASDARSRFIEKNNQQIDTQSPVVPTATLAYQRNQLSLDVNHLNGLSRQNTQQSVAVSV